MSEHTQSHRRGIAVGVRRRWPAMHDAYTEVCRSGQLHPGGVFVYRAPDRLIVAAGQR